MCRSLRGRTAHEAIFNPASGAFRCPSSQQGYSPFTTWTRGLAWAMLGFAEQLEFIQSLPESEFGADGVPRKGEACAMLERAARATCDFYIHQASALDGICYWDTGAPQLASAGRLAERKPADPFNDYEPVDSSASAIAAQGLIRLGHALGECRTQLHASRIDRVAAAARGAVSLSRSASRRNSVAQCLSSAQWLGSRFRRAAKIPCGESSMWGDYHLLEAMLLVARMAEGSYYTFF